MIRRTTLFLPLLAMTLAPFTAEPVQAQPAERPTAEGTRNFKAFGEFLGSLRRSGKLPRMIPAMIEQYRAHLVAEGASEAAAEARIATFERWVGDNPRRLFWNVVLSSDKFKTEPNRFLARMLDRLKPGRALDVGMGSGRNAVYLAQQGWDVTGVDPAIFAVETAVQKASDVGVEINTVVSGAEDFDWGEDQWDLILFCYADVEPFLDQARHSLRSGGVVIVEGFHGVSENKVYFDDNALIELLDGFRILQYEDVEDMPDFGQERRGIIRILAQKP